MQRGKQEVPEEFAETYRFVLSAIGSRDLWTVGQALQSITLHDDATEADLQTARQIYEHCNGARWIDGGNLIRSLLGLPTTSKG